MKVSEKFLPFAVTGFTMLSVKNYEDEPPIPLLVVDFNTRTEAQWLDSDIFEDIVRN
jgi:hypothetical protein